jgi:hypothetical protein
MALGNRLASKSHASTRILPSLTALMTLKRIMIVFVFVLSMI